MFRFASNNFFNENLRLITKKIVRKDPHRRKEICLL